MRVNPDIAFIKPQFQRSTFVFEGNELAATLYTPAQPAKKYLPAILMVGGWGSVQRAFTYPFVCHFVQAGFAVMEFDFQGWGLSAGWPRQDINPWARVRAASAALAHLKAQEGVDPTHIIAWGTSFGGGHVVDLAVQHPDLQGVIAHVPMLDGLQAVKAVPFFTFLKFSLYFTAGVFKPGYALTIPTIAPAGEFATMDRDGAWEAKEIGIAAMSEIMDDAMKKVKYVNAVTTRSLITMGFYRPVSQLKKIRVPTLLIGATQDTVAPYVAEKIAAVNNPYIETFELDANHFDPYFEPCFSPNIAAQLAFLRKLL